MKLFVVNLSQREREEKVLITDSQTCLSIEAATRMLLSEINHR